MSVLAKGRSADEILDFLYKRFDGFLFELRK
jgi:hypothetical protein